MLWWYLEVSLRLAAEGETAGGNALVQLVLDAILKLLTASVAEPRVLVCAIAPCCWCVCSWSTPIGRIQVLLWTVRSLPKTDCSYCNLCSLTTDGNSLGLYQLWWKWFLLCMLGMHLATLTCTAESDPMTTPQSCICLEVTEFLFSCFYLELERRRRCAKERRTALQKRSLLRLCQLKSSLTRLVSKTSQNRARKESQKNKINKGLHFRTEAQ